MGLLLAGWALKATPTIAPSGERLTLRLQSVRAGPVEEPGLGSTGEQVAGPFHRCRQPRAGVLADLSLSRGASARLDAGALPDGRPLALEVTWLP